MLSKDPVPSVEAAALLGLPVRRPEHTSRYRCRYDDDGEIAVDYWSYADQSWRAAMAANYVLIGLEAGHYHWEIENAENS